MLRLLSLILVVAILAGCTTIPTTIRGSGNAVTKEYDLAGFSKIAAGSAFSVDITRSDRFSVVITVDDNLVEYLDVTVTGDTLRLGMKPHLTVGFNNTRFQAKVTMPELRGLDLSGATRTTVSGFESDRSLAVKVSGASTLRGDIESDDARFEVSGASTVELSGRAAKLNLEVSGASKARLDKFDVSDGNVRASGASSATVKASGNLDIEASGASTVHYVGKPASLQVDTSGASNVSQQ